MAHIISSEEFQNLVLDSDKPVLVDFFATWCGPCQMLAPVIEDLSAENDDFEVYKVDVDESEDLALKYRIMSVPTLCRFEDGEVVSKIVGARSKAELIEFMTK